MEQAITEISREEFFCKLEVAEEVDYVSAGWKHGTPTQTELTFYESSTFVIRNFPRGHKSLMELTDNLKKQTEGISRKFFTFGKMLISRSKDEINDDYYFYRYFRLKF